MKQSSYHSHYYICTTSSKLCCSYPFSPSQLCCSLTIFWLKNTDSLNFKHFSRYTCILAGWRYTWCKFDFYNWISFLSRLCICIESVKRANIKLYRTEFILPQAEPWKRSDTTDTNNPSGVQFIIFLFQRGWLSVKVLDNYNTLFFLTFQFTFLKFRLDSPISSVVDEGSSLY